jgi:hypothetical protein
MKLTQKLLGYLNRAFSRDPVQFMALRISYDGAMVWTIEDAVLTTTVTGGTGTSHVVQLSDYNLAQLANYFAALPGYSVPFQISGTASTLSARVLMDGTGDQVLSNGDHLYAYTSLTWAFLEASAYELKHAREQIYQMLRQMVVPTAEDEWLDEIGGYYNVRRQDGEIDSTYGPRIIYEVIRPRNNNKAIELAISQATGGLPSKVTDVTIPGDISPLYNGDIDHDGSRLYNATGKYRRNLFDVEYAFDLEGAEDIAPFQARVLGIIDQFRSAGTHLRQILLQSGQLVDTATYNFTDSLDFVGTVTMEDSVDAQTDDMELSGILGLTDTAVMPADGDLVIESLSVHTYNGVHFYGGSGRVVNYDSGETVIETL